MCESCYLQNELGVIVISCLIKLSKRVRSIGAYLLAVRCFGGKINSIDKKLKIDLSLPIESS